MKFNPSLYLITDSINSNENTLLHTVEEACIGGATMVQMRDKNNSDRDCLQLGFKMKNITDKYRIPLLIDDRLDIAMILKCGVHLGQGDIPISYARKFLGDKQIIGATTKTVEQAIRGELDGADYLGVGPIFPTTTKVQTVLTKLSTLNSICEAVKIPVMAIGGLSISNLSVLDSSPIDGICVVSAIMKSQNPRLESQKLRAAINNIVKSK